MFSNIPHKLKSVKFWVFIAVTVVICFFLWSGKITSGDFINYVKWALPTFFFSNVFSKYATHGIKNTENQNKSKKSIDEAI